MSTKSKIFRSGFGLVIRKAVGSMNAKTEICFLLLIILLLILVIFLLIIKDVIPLG